MKLACSVSAAGDVMRMRVDSRSSTTSPVATSTITVVPGTGPTGYTIAAEVLGVPVKMDKDTTEGKAALAMGAQNATAALDATGCCLMATFAIGPEHFAELTATATGIDYDADSIMKVGDRIFNLERMFNLRAGLTAADDTLPPRLLNEPMPSGPSKGLFNHLPDMLPEYYGLRGWSPDGVPTPEKLKELALGA